MRGRSAQNSEIAYTMPSISGIALEIHSSANAWWMDEEKMQLLYAAFSFDCSIREACAYAGITEKQYKYFRSLHPEIDVIREGLEARLILRARKTVVDALSTNFRAAMRYLELKRPDEFGRPSRRKVQKFQTGMGTPLMVLTTYNSKVSISSKNSIDDSQLV